MNRDNSFQMWGERGLIATFFADLYQLDNKVEVQNILKMAGISEEQSESQVTPEKIHSIIEPDFGNAGFGHPDAIFSVDYANKRIVVIVEAKRENFAKACRPSSQRGEGNFNWTLNGQLELDFCLAMALSEFTNGDTKLIEPNWILGTPYNKERGGKLRYVKNFNVLQDVVKHFSSEKFEQYRWLVITTDKENPLDSVGKNLLPELFMPEFSGIRMNITNCWEKYRGRFGWLNYENMMRFIERIQEQLPIGSFFLPTYEINKGNLQKPTSEIKKKPSTIEEPKIEDLNEVFKKIIALFHGCEVVTCSRTTSIKKSGKTIAKLKRQTQGVFVGVRLDIIRNNEVPEAWYSGETLLETISVQGVKFRGIEVLSGSENWADAQSLVRGFLKRL
jgi:hypothetical protein